MIELTKVFNPIVAQVEVHKLFLLRQVLDLPNEVVV